MIVRALKKTALVLSLIVLAMPARAELGVDYDHIELRRLQSGSQTIEPDRGYIYVEAPERVAGMFLKLPDEADWADYHAEWEEEFAEAREDYPSKLARWRSDVAMAERLNDDPPEKPIEPTRDNFSIGNILFRNIAPFGPQFKFAKDLERDGFSYLTAVEPGSYVYYGSVQYLYGANAFGTCYCMGTVRFEVVAGEIVDFGNLATLPADEPVSAEDLRFGVPEVLNGYPHAPVQLRAFGKIDNHFALRIARMPPIEGVLAYERDRVVDLQWEGRSEATDSEAESEVDQSGDDEPSSTMGMGASVAPAAPADDD